MKTLKRFAAGDDPARDRKHEARKQQNSELNRIALGEFVKGKRVGAAPLTKPWSRRIGRKLRHH